MPALALALFSAAAGAGLAMPVMPAIVSRVGGGGAAYGLLASIAALAQLLASPLWGGLADRVGRKPVLAVGLGGLAASLAAFAYADTLALLVASRAVTGLLSAAVLPAALASASDASGEGERLGVIGRLMALFALGAIAGPGIGGLLGEIGHRAPLLIGAGISSLSLLVVAFMPETARHGESHNAMRETIDPGLAEALPDTVPSAPSGMGGQPATSRSRGSRSLGPLLALMVVASFGTACFTAVFAMDATRRFSMGPGAVGGLLAGVAAAAALAQGLVAGPASRLAGDGGVAAVSLAGGAAGFLALACAGRRGWYVAAAVFYVLAHTLLRPSLQSIASKRGDRARGASLGLAGSAQSLGGALGPLAAGALLDLDPRLPYLLGALVLGASLAASRRLLAGEARNPLRRDPAPP